MKRHQLLAALESVRAWARELPDDVEPFRIQPIPGLVIQARDGRSSNAEKCARYRQRKATGVATPNDTLLDTHTTRVATGVQHVSQPASDTVPAPRPSSPPLHSPSDSLTPSDPKESAAVSEGSDRSDAGAQKAAAASESCEATSGLGRTPSTGGAQSHGRAPAAEAALHRDWSKRPPANLDDALEMPLQARAELVLRDPFRASYLDPHRWPEVRMAVVAFREAVRKPKLAVGLFSTDLGVRRLVELYAAGLTADEVCSAIPLVVASGWWTSGDSARDLGSISLTVLRRALAEHKPAPATDLAALPRQMFGGGS
jgi:hypothetical protein